MRLLRFALGNIRRSLILSISSITVIGLMTFLIFVMFLVEFVLQGLANSVNSRLSLVLNVQAWYASTSREIVDALAIFRSIDPSIDASFASEKDNFEILRTRDPELAKIVETDTENPLPSTISIKNVPIDKYNELNTRILANAKLFEINEEKQKESVISYRGQYDRLQNVVQILHSLRFGLYMIIVFFLLSVFVVVYHSIGNAVFFFREEIRITELVGGQRRYIYGPFLIQGMIYASVALIISWWIFWLLTDYIHLETIIGPAFSIPQFLSSSGLLLFITGVSVVCLWALSWLVSSWRFVR